MLQMVSVLPTTGAIYEFTNPTLNYTLGVDDVIAVYADNGDDSAYIEVARTDGDDWAFGYRVDYKRDATNDVPRTGRY